MLFRRVSTFPLLIKLNKNLLYCTVLRKYGILASPVGRDIGVCDKKTGLFDMRCTYKFIQLFFCWKVLIFVVVNNIPGTHVLKKFSGLAISAP